VRHLLEEHLPRVYRFARRLTRDPHAAEDLTQETFLRAWRSRDRLRDAGGARVWLFTIAANIWRDWLRRGKSRVAAAGPLDETGIALWTCPDAIASEREQCERALQALDSLPGRQREVLYLCAVEELKAADIARVLEINVAAVRASLSLARQRLRVLLAEEEKSRNP
jgi:RNA polymerase sigma-70 factor (ECF subfamily)